MNRPPTTGAAPDGERAARFTAVATDVWEPLQRYLRRRAQPADVDDIAAEALAVMWRRVDDIPVGAEVPWTYAIARRCLANHRRGATRRRGLVDRIRHRGEVDVAASHTVDPAAAIDQADPRLAAALAQLSVDDRELLSLWAWEQLSVTEIAIALETVPNTVSVRLRRARQRLAEHLGDHPSRTVEAPVDDMSASSRPGCHINEPAGHTTDGCTQETPR